MGRLHLKEASMKLTFKLWGIHPKWPRKEGQHCPWVIKDDNRYHLNDLDVNCISFLHEPTQKDTSSWINYHPRKL